MGGFYIVRVCKSNIGTVLSVSYTHLDVYKRQGFKRLSDNRKATFEDSSDDNPNELYYKEIPYICLLYTSIPVNSALAPFPFRMLMGYKQDTWEPKEPETHSMTPPSSTTARFVFRLSLIHI